MFSKCFKIFHHVFRVDIWFPIFDFLQEFCECKSVCLCVYICFLSFFFGSFSSFCWFILFWFVCFCFSNFLHRKLLLSNYDDDEDDDFRCLCAFQRQRERVKGCGFEWVGKRGEVEGVEVVIRL